jgi:hypothetical protein
MPAAYMPLIILGVLMTTDDTLSDTPNRNRFQPKTINSLISKNSLS